MTNQPGELSDVQGVTDPETVLQQNLEIAARMLWKREPTYQSGSANAITGPPTSGARVLGELWIDQNLAGWLCTVAGTPGTWRQVIVPIVTALPGSPTSNYLVDDGSDGTIPYRRKRWNGSSWTNLF